MKDRSLRVKGSATLLSVAMCAACFPVAWVLPPTQLDVGVGAANTSDDRFRTGEEDVAYTHKSVVLDARASVSPLAAVAGFEDRLVDVSAGYGMRHAWMPKLVTHGPFLGASVMIPVTDTPGRRLTLGAQLHALIGARRMGNAIAGNRASGRVGFEWSSWREGPFDECSFDLDGGFCGGGYSFGEIAWSPYIEVSRAQVQRQSEWGVTAGMTLRLPASVGAGLVFVNPCE